MFLWSESGASVCDIPIETDKNFDVNRIRWNTNGKSLVVSDKRNQAVIAYPHFSFLEGADDE